MHKPIKAATKSRRVNPMSPISWPSRIEKIKITMIGIATDNDLDILSKGICETKFGIPWDRNIYTRVHKTAIKNIRV
jgi:hypothetical protein